MFYLLIFIIGLILGSFSSVIIHRLHTGESGVFWGRSKCPKCHHVLGFLDLMPLISYLFFKGKCRHCKKRISAFYPILELLMGGMMLLTTFLTGKEDVLLLLFSLFITFVFVLLSVYDYLYKEVPDSVSLPAVLITFIFVLATGRYELKSLLIGLLIPVLFFGTLFFGSKGRWLGGGDIRIGALMGSLLAYPDILVGLFLAYLLGSIFSLLGLATGFLHRKSQVPFAPFLLLGAYTAFFWGDLMRLWYFGLI